MVLGYYHEPRFNACAAGFKEYTIVGVKVTYTPHRVVSTTAADAVQVAYQSSIITDHTTITALNINAINDQTVLGQSKPKSYMPEEKMVRYLRFGYYADTQFSKKYLRTTGGGTITRQTWVTDEQEEVPAIVIRTVSSLGQGAELGEVHIRVYYRFQGKSLA